MGERPVPLQPVGDDVVLDELRTATGQRDDPPRRDHRRDDERRAHQSQAPQPRAAASREHVRAHDGEAEEGGGALDEEADAEQGVADRHRARPLAEPGRHERRHGAGEHETEHHVGHRHAGHREHAVRGEHDEAGREPDSAIPQPRADPPRGQRHAERGEERGPHRRGLRDGARRPRRQRDQPGVDRRLVEVRHVAEPRHQPAAVAQHVARQHRKARLVVAGQHPGAGVEEEQRGAERQEHEQASGIAVTKPRHGARPRQEVSGGGEVRHPGTANPADRRRPPAPARRSRSP